MSKRKGIISCLIVLVIFSCIMFWNGFMRGSDFAWTVQQDRYWNAVIEMALVFWIYLGILSWRANRKYFRYISIGCVFLAFSFLHSFFWASLVCIIYALMIYLTGSLLNRIVLKNNDKILNCFHFNFVTGMATIIVIVGIASCFKLGTPDRLRILFLLILLFELLVVFKQIKKGVLTFYEKTNESEMSGDSKVRFIGNIAIALIITMLTLVVCRANLGTDYDSLWYGLRSEFVLAPNNGIYDKITLMACVYTYSKGIEVLALPFSGLSTYSFILGVNVLFCVMTLWAVYDLGRTILNKRYSIMMVLLVSLTPSIMNMAVTAKSDMATIYLQIVVLIYAINAIKNSNGKYLAMSCAALVLSFGFKPSSIVFSTLIVLVVILFAFMDRIRVYLKDIKVLIVSLSAVFVLWVRTWMITGYPITSLLVPLFEKMGFYPKYPYTLPSANTMSVKELFSTGAIWERLIRLFRIFFTPDAGDMYTLEATWWGNLFSVLWIVAMLLILVRPIKTITKMKNDILYAFQVVSLMICSGASIGCMLILSTPDGNYFMLMQILTYWYIATELMCLKNIDSSIACFVGMPLIFCNFLLSIAISWSWMVGLTPINISNWGYYNHEQLYIAPCLSENSLTEIEAYLSAKMVEESKPWRMIGFTRKDQAIHLLSAIIECSIQQEAWASDILETAENFQRFLEFADVDGILIEEEYILEQKKYFNILSELAENGVLHIEYKANDFLILRVEEKQSDNNTVQYFEGLTNCS